MRNQWGFYENKKGIKTNRIVMQFLLVVIENGSSCNP